MDLVNNSLECCWTRFFSSSMSRVESISGVSFFIWLQRSSLCRGSWLKFWKTNFSCWLKSGSIFICLGGVLNWNFVNISSTLIINVAPYWMSLLVPSDQGESIWPGRAKTSRFWFRAFKAVIIAPLLLPDSTTNTPFERPLIIRFLFGKLTASGFVPWTHTLNSC